jgi:hypothetical protein
MQPRARLQTSEVAKYGHHGATRRDETVAVAVACRIAALRPPFSVVRSGQTVRLRNLFSSIAVIDVDVLGIVSTWSPFFGDDRSRVRSISGGLGGSPP